MAKADSTFLRWYQPDQVQRVQEIIRSCLSHLTAPLVDFYYKNFAYNDTIKYVRRQPEFEVVIHVNYVDGNVKDGHVFYVQMLNTLWIQ